MRSDPQPQARDCTLLPVQDYNYWHHIKYAVIGMFSQAVIALPVGLLVMWQ